MSGAHVRSLGRASFSTLFQGETQIGRSQFGHELASILAALGGTKLDGTLGHDVLLCGMTVRI